MNNASTLLGKVGGGGGGAWGGLSYECDRDARQIEDRIRVFMAWANPYEQ